ncbi:PREDICTED: methylmalonic aciduria and homocystinuria type D homolog, mitochondrial-like, partial [Priapulus caudatus]|uniref:Methylmalonic aciduria and homocystinuria type D homolog, mitochondrial-like n=1 Tax=Priapulus caudatus TaxID=37621 RepID=A0ABM1F707_PRICU
MNRMAKQMVCRRSCLVAYMPSFGAAATRVRSFSTRDEQTGGPYIYVNPPQDISVTVWPDGRLGPFAPKDQRFPMPGLVGSVCQVDKKTAVPQVQRAPAAEADVLTAPLPEERHIDALSQFFSPADEVRETLQH